MMPASILAHAVLSDCEIDGLQDRPEFRRATRSSLLAWAVANQVMLNLPTALTSSLKEQRFQNSVLVYGTSFGELEATRDFLFSIKTQDHARPILFQNSLHNTTLGQLTQWLNFGGPSLTVSHRDLTAEKSLDTAISFLSPEIPYALVVCCDAFIEDFRSGYEAYYPSGVRLREGAAAAFLSHNDAGIRIESISFADVGPPPQGEYYDSMGLEYIIRELQSDSKRSSIEIRKPFGPLARVRLQNV